MRTSLRLRLTIIFIALAIVPLIAVGIRLANASFNLEREQAIQLQTQIAQRTSTEVEAFLQDIENDFNLLGRAIRDLEQPDRAQWLSLLLGAFNIGPYRDVYEEFTLLDAEGQELIRVSRDETIPVDELQNQADSAEFNQPRETGEIYFSSVWFEEETNKAFVTIAIPFSQVRSVELQGVLVAKLRFKAVSDLIAGEVSTDHTQTIYMIDSTEQVVAHQDASVVHSGLRFTLPENDDTQIGLLGDDVVLGRDEIKLGTQTLTVISERAEGDALQTATNIISALVTTLVVTLIIAIALGIFVARQIVRPIEAMSDTAQAISAGDLSKQVDVFSQDELGTLATAFNSMTAQLSESIGSLEQRVSERTQRLELIAGISEQLNTILDLNELMSQVVNQIKEKFDYYHIHIYLLDDKYVEDLVVVAGTGEAGQEMVRERHRISLSTPTSLVALAARSREIIRVDNVRENPNWLPNALLPNTYAEMAVPIILEGEVVGVLDVQEDRVGGFVYEDESLLRTLANQVAVAIRNARQFATVQAALTEAHELQQRYVTDSWDRSRVERRGRGRVQFSLGESSSLTDQAVALARGIALRSEALQLVDLNNGTRGSVDTAATNGTDGIENGSRALVAPITLQGIPIGNLQLHEGKAKAWTDNELALVEAVLQQVSQTAETLRLVETVQERASREQLINQISDKLRRAPDLETLMEIGTSELSKVLRPARTFIKFGDESETESDAPEAAHQNGLPPEFELGDER